MTAFDTFEESTTMAPAKTSGLAIASLICSCIFCCPITTLLGPLLGLIAVLRIKSNPQLKGTGLAVVAILLGLIFTILQGFGAKFMWDNFYRVMLRGPNDALVAGFGGDPAGFRTDFTGDAENATDPEIQAFVDDLRDRYGEFTKAWIHPESDFPGTGDESTEMTYELVFADATVTCDAMVVLFQPPDGPPSFLLESLTVRDPNLGDLHFPAGSEADADADADDTDADAENGTQDEAPDSGE